MSGEMVESPPRPLDRAALQALWSARCLLLITYKRDGSPVATPVWPFELDGRLLASSQKQAWKLKRVVNNSHVLVATCTQRGRQTGPTYEARARILDAFEVEPAMRAKRRRWWAQRIIDAIHRDTKQVPFEIYIAEDV